METGVGEAFLKAVHQRLEKDKAMTERAAAQVSFEQLKQVDGHF